jgi:hypothetical protein
MANTGLTNTINAAPLPRHTGPMNDLRAPKPLGGGGMTTSNAMIGKALPTFGRNPSVGRVNPLIDGTNLSVRGSSGVRSGSLGRQTNW